MYKQINIFSTIEIINLAVLWYLPTGNPQEAILILLATLVVHKRIRINQEVIEVV